MKKRKHEPCVAPGPFSDLSCRTPIGQVAQGIEMDMHFRGQEVVGRRILRTKPEGGREGGSTVRLVGRKLKQWMLGGWAVRPERRCKELL